MKKFMVIAVAILSTAPAIGMAEPWSESAGREVLNRWLGIWEFQTEIKPAAWSLQAQGAVRNLKDRVDTGRSVSADIEPDR